MYTGKDTFNVYLNPINDVVNLSIVINHDHNYCLPSEENLKTEYMEVNDKYQYCLPKEEILKAEYSEVDDQYQYCTLKEENLKAYNIEVDTNEYKDIYEESYLHSLISAHADTFDESKDVNATANHTDNDEFKKHFRMSPTEFVDVNDSDSISPSNQAGYDDIDKMLNNSYQTRIYQSISKDNVSNPNLFEAERITSKFSTWKIRGSRLKPLKPKQVVARPLSHSSVVDESVDPLTDPLGTQYAGCSPMMSKIETSRIPSGIRISYFRAYNENGTNSKVLYKPVSSADVFEFVSVRDDTRRDSIMKMNKSKLEREKRYRMMLDRERLRKMLPITPKHERISIIDILKEAKSYCVELQSQFNNLKLCRSFEKKKNISLRLKLENMKSMTNYDRN